MTRKDHPHSARGETPRQIRRPVFADAVNKHPLIVHVMQDLRPLLPFFSASAMQWATSRSRASPIPDGTDPLATRTHTRAMDGFSPRHAYVLDVFSHAASLLSAIEALEDIHVYIGGFPQPRTYQRLGITQDKWIHYHFTHYALIVVAIYDTSLLLTNAVFALGLDPKVCNNETVLGNTHVVRTAVKAAFGQLESVTSRYRHPRNLFAHRSQIPKLELLDILEMFSLVQRYSEPVLEPQRLDALYQIAKSEIAAALAAQTAAEIQGIQSLLTALDPTYRRKRSELDAKPTGSSPRATLAT